MVKELSETEMAEYNEIIISNIKLMMSIVVQEELKSIFDNINLIDTKFTQLLATS